MNFQPQNNLPAKGEQTLGDDDFLPRRPPSWFRTAVTATLMGVLPQTTLPSLSELRLGSPSTGQSGPCQATGAPVCCCATKTPENSRQRDQVPGNRGRLGSENLAIPDKREEEGDEPGE